MYQLRLLVGHGVSYIQIGEKAMATKEKGRQWDGISRPSDDKYRENFNRIFGNKSEDNVHDHVDKDHANKEKEKDV